MSVEQVDLMAVEFAHQAYQHRAIQVEAQQIFEQERLSAREFSLPEVEAQHHLIAPAVRVGALLEALEAMEQQAEPRFQEVVVAPQDGGLVRAGSWESVEARQLRTAMAVAADFMAEAVVIHQQVDLHIPQARFF